MNHVYYYNFVDFLNQEEDSISCSRHCRYRMIAEFGTILCCDDVRLSNVVSQRE